MVIKPKPCQRYFFPSHLFTFYSLAQLLLPTVKLNGLSQKISIEYSMVHGSNQACLEPKIWICSVFSYVLEQVSNVTMSEKTGLSL